MRTSRETSGKKKREVPTKAQTGGWSSNKLLLLADAIKGNQTKAVIKRSVLFTLVLIFFNLCFEVW